MFYTLLSSYLSRTFLIEGCNSVDISSTIKSEFTILFDTLSLIIERIKRASQKDSNLNALARLASMSYLFEMKYEVFLKELKEKIIT